MSEAGEELRRLIEAHGRGLGQEPQRLRALLSAAAPRDVRGVNVLTAAARAGVPAALSADPGAPGPAARRKLRDTLVEEFALVPPAARWAVDAWACALGMLPPSRRAGIRPPATRAPWWRRHRLALRGLAVLLAAVAGIWAYVWIMAPVKLDGRAGPGATEIGCVAFSADGSLGISAGGKAVHVWDLESRKEVCRFSGHARAVQEAVVSADGHAVLSCDGQDAVLWDAATGREIRRLAWPGRPGAPGDSVPLNVALSPDGRTALVGSAAKARFDIWDLSSGQTRTFRWDPPASAKGIAAFGPQGRRVVFAGGPEAIVRLWDLQKGTEVRRFEVNTRGVTCAAFSPDPGAPGRLLTGDRGGVVRLWDVDSGRGLLAMENHLSPVLCVAFGPKGRLISADAIHLVIRTAPDGECVGRYDLTRELRLGHAAAIQSVAVCVRSRRLLAGCADGVVRLWPLPK